MPPLIRKCTSDGCPSENSAKDLTWYCMQCKDPIHLICYGVKKPPEEIFIIDNIVIMCDECLANPFAYVSPKRKQPNMTQRTIDTTNPTMQLAKTTVNVSTPPKSGSNKPNYQLQTVVESLVKKVETQTATISKLKGSVDSMHQTIAQQNANVEKSLKINTDSMSSINQLIIETPKAVQSAVKQSYAAAVKNSGLHGNVTPKSSFRKNGTTPSSSTQVKNPAAGKPAISGTSVKIIGKQLSPINQNRLNNRMNAERIKAVWVSKLHRDTTEEELETYVKDLVGDSVTDQFKVRKLVRKDRELSSYSFISFKITCPERMLQTLLDPSKWPSACQIREFEMDRTPSTGTRIGAATSSELKNGEATTTDQTKPELKLRDSRLQEIADQIQQMEADAEETNVLTNDQAIMDASQVIH